MISFRQYILEVVSFQNNTLFAVHPSGEMLFKHSTERNPWPEHVESFPNLKFISGESPSKFTEIEKPKAQSWGRIDHKNKVLHIMTHAGMEIPTQIKNKKALESDVFSRIGASRQLEKKYPEYSVHHGYTGEGDEKKPRIISYGQYRKELLTHVYGDDSQHYTT